MKIQQNNRGAIWGSLALLGISLLIWINYLFFYDPRHGALILLVTIPVGLLGIIQTMFIKMLPLKVGLVILHLVFCGSFLVPFVLWGLLGA